MDSCHRSFPVTKVEVIQSIRTTDRAEVPDDVAMTVGHLEQVDLPPGDVDEFRQDPLDGHLSVLESAPGMSGEWCKLMLVIS